MTRYALVMTALAGTMLLVSPPAAAADPANGAVVFHRCAACHSVERGKKGALGPNLRGIVGRKAGAADFAYSRAMKNSGVVWTPANLDAFLKKPAAVVPGNRMGFIGIAKKKDRADLIAFLLGKK